MPKVNNSSAILQAADRNYRTLFGRISSTIKSGRAGLNVKALTEALNAGVRVDDVDDIVDAALRKLEASWRGDDSQDNLRTAVSSKGVSSVLRKTLKDAANVTRIPGAAGGKGGAGSFTLAFDGKNPEAIRWAKERSAALVTNITAETRGAIRSIIARGQAGISIAEQAKFLRGIVGLTERDANTLFNFRSALIDNPGKTVNLGSTRVRVPEKGLTRSELSSKLDRQATLLANRRAKVIARTETIAASNEGQRQLWMQALDKGLLTGTEERQWMAAASERTCPICSALDGEVQPLIGGMFSGGYEQPPAHPNCRCTVVLLFKAVAKGQRKAA